MNTKILDDVKRMLGIEASTTEFDIDIQSGINSAFFFLNQLGVGPKDCFSASNESIWDDFTTSASLDTIRDYVYLKTRLQFDPPTTSFVLEALKGRISELEFYLNIQSDDGGGNAHDTRPE